jgi:predicted Zn finger-like uncharacterized protein
MRFVCESCRAQYMINDEKVGPKGVKVRCRKCGYVILVKRDAAKSVAPVAPPPDVDLDEGQATQLVQSPLAREAALAPVTGPGPSGATAVEPMQNGGGRSVAAPARASTPPPAPDSSGDLTPVPGFGAQPESGAAPPTPAANSELSMLSSALDTLGNDLSSPGSDEPTQLKPGPSAADFSGSPKERGFASSESLLGADEDEIGAVFDQVLSGDKQRPRLAEAASEDDRESTRVLDAGLAKRLAEESGSGPESSREVPQLDAPQTDWYVAINEKQMGPLSLEAVKAHWDHGEIGPDSLCWRQGQGDWLPVSEVKILAGVLAPKPPRPIVVPAAATVSSSMSAGAVVSVPVQSAFSAGGVVHTVQSEMQVPMGGPSPAASSLADREDTGNWKPSAASALASLVSAELNALAKPAAPKVASFVEPSLSRVPGLLDLSLNDERSAVSMARGPTSSAQAREGELSPERTLTTTELRGGASTYAPPPTGSSFTSPAVTSYRPPLNRGLVIGLAVGGGSVVLILVGLVVWLATRAPQLAASPVVPPDVVAANIARPQSAPPVVLPAQPAVPTVAPPVAPPVPSGAGVVAALPNDARATKAPDPVPGSERAPPQPTDARRPAETRRLGTESTASRTPSRVAAVERPSPTQPPRDERPAKPDAKEEGGGDDDFAEAFGAAKPGRRGQDGAGDESRKPKSVYVPPAPGGGGAAKEKLETSDVMEGVLAHKAALGRCAEEQHRREPGVAGKLVMKWTILTSGRTSQVSCVTDEFKGTYFAGCVGGLIKGMSFPKHKAQGDPVQFPFKF